MSMSAQVVYTWLHLTGTDRQLTGNWHIHNWPVIFAMYFAVYIL